LPYRKEEIKMFYGFGAILTKGSSGSEVKKLQQNLIALGFKLPRYGADGVYGDETAKAVMDFQYTWGIKIDGIAGPETLSAIDQAMALLVNGQWNPETDPMEYTPLSVVIPKVSITPTVTPTITPRIQPQVAGFDIEKYGKYLLIGGAVILGAFLLKGSKRKRR
jgi:peptidoglycan hydrolase-like protein with peptidoglycan-binding domain